MRENKLVEVTFTARTASAVFPVIVLMDLKLSQLLIGIRRTNPVSISMNLTSKVLVREIPNAKTVRVVTPATVLTVSRGNFVMILTNVSHKACDMNAQCKTLKGVSHVPATKDTTEMVSEGDAWMLILQNCVMRP